MQKMAKKRKKWLKKGKKMAFFDKLGFYVFVDKSQNAA